MADVGDQNHTNDAPTAPFRKIVLPPTDETISFRRAPTGASAQPPAPDPGQRPGSAPPGRQSEPVRPLPPSPPLPPLPPPPPRGGLLSRIGDIPIKVVYLLGTILATVLAVLLVFVIFSGDVPHQPETDQVVPVAPVPSASGAVSGSASASPSGAALPAAPAKKAFPKLSGKASAAIGTITDDNSGISYPRLGKPWVAKSFPPFSVAQRSGKVAVPHTVIASAMLPGDDPAAKPSTDADYRAVAVLAARWTLRTQYPKGATLTWTGSQKTPVGKGWTLGFEVGYTQAGEQRQGQAMVSVLEVGKTKPAMLMASIPESGKAHWVDLNTLVTKVRPL
ncbi:hypothetical protein [Nonomuraea sp. LPB2021202275-12-8]|uniref:hypothetical protein n=1 Tax=Nonomuraea sp. LPB2021202275-12-8 TaxID=3120159 RepID=UPI00300C53C7